VETRRVGERYSPEHNTYSEGTQYCYHAGVHDLVLFWRSPTPAEIIAFENNAVEFGWLVDFPALFFLYRIQNACEWSDVAYSVYLLQPGEQCIPPDDGQSAPVRITLVDAGDGTVLAVRELALGPRLAQVAARVMEAQRSNPWSRIEFDSAVKSAYARYADTEAMLAHAIAIESALIP
jgi:hypothetical protein